MDPELIVEHFEENMDKLCNRCQVRVISWIYDICKPCQEDTE